MDRPQKTRLTILVVAAGAAALTGQTLIARELMVSFYGTEFAMAAALACWLLFVPVGALAGALALKTRAPALGLVLCSLSALGLTLVSGFFAARLIRPMLGLDAGEFVSLSRIVLSGLLCAGPMSFFVGFLFPAACRCAEAQTGLQGRGIARVYTAEAIGSCGAGSAMSFILLRFQTPTAIAVLAGGAVWVLCGLWSAASSRRTRLPAGVFLVVPALWLVLCPFGAGGAVLLSVAMCTAALAGLVALQSHRGESAALRSWAAISLGFGFLVCLAFLSYGDELRRVALRQRWSTFTRFNLVASRETPYQHIAIGNRQGLWIVVQNGLHSERFPDDVSSARAAALLLTQHPSPRSVLVVGGGLGGLCQHMLKAPLERLDYVEMDPGLVRFVYAHLPERLAEPLAQDRFAAYICDGRRFIRNVLRKPAPPADTAWAPNARSPGLRHRPAAPYDIVAINVGDPTSASASRFYTEQFFREVRQALHEGGIVAIFGITGSENYLEGSVLQYAACLYKTLKRVFPHVVIRPGDELCFFAASSGGVATAHPPTLRTRFDRLGLKPSRMRYMFAMDQFPDEKVAYTLGRLESAAGAAPLNTDEHPSAFPLFLSVQEHYARQRREAAGTAPVPAGKGFFGSVLGVRPAWVIVPFLAVMLFLGGLRACRGRAVAAPWASGFAVLTTGVFGLSVEMLIMYLYQTQFGYIYRDISVLIGLFMLGLAFGAWLTGRGSLGAAGKVLVAVESLQVVLVLGLPAAVGILSLSPYLFLLLSAVAGFLTGAEFPVACRIGLSSGSEEGTVAGLFDACDHAGALVGAALTGLVLMPVFGLVQSALLLSCIKSTSLLGIFVSTAGRARR